MANTGERRTLDPKLDIVFWMLFGAEQNRELLLSLLNAVLKPACPIEAIEVLHAEPERLRVHDKGIALDVRVRLASGEQVDVEMQSHRRPAQRESALYYWARLYCGQLLRGDPYTALRRAIVIFFANFVEPGSRRFHSQFQVIEDRTQELLTDHLEVHWLQLPLLQDAIARNDEPALAAWASAAHVTCGQQSLRDCPLRGMRRTSVFLAGAPPQTPRPLRVRLVQRRFPKLMLSRLRCTRFLMADDATLEELAMESPVLKHAKDALETLSADPEARERAEMRELALISYELDLTKAREQGKAEGRTEGKAEPLASILTSKFGELPPSAMERLHQASAAKLVRWGERLLTARTLTDVFT